MQWTLRGRESHPTAVVGGGAPIPRDTSAEPQYTCGTSWRLLANGTPHAKSGIMLQPFSAFFPLKTERIGKQTFIFLGRGEPTEGEDAPGAVSEPPMISSSATTSSLGGGTKEGGSEEDICREEK